MKPFQKQRIEELRVKGKTYAVIADELGLSINTIKSHCRRKGVGTTDICPECGQLLEHLPHKKKKRFCCEKCRVAWWVKNPQAINRKTVYNFECLICKKPFTAYTAKRKYCSRSCSASSRSHNMAMQP